MQIDAATRDLELCQVENNQLKAETHTLTVLNEQLNADKAALERQAVERYYDHARQLHDCEREQETLERVVQFLETEQVAVMVRIQALLSVVGMI